MLQLFYISDLTNPRLTGDNAHHAERVLRMRAGEELLVSDGNGKWARCLISTISKREVNLQVLETGIESATTIEISVLQALPKSDRSRETVELLTASGVTNIYPWQAARSIGKESDKWESAAIEASKQSRRFYIPKVSNKLDLEQAMELAKTYEQILICHESATLQLSEVVRTSIKTLLVIGPEGGITDSELASFEGIGGKTIRLGRPILRSAHAGIAAVSAVSALLKVW